MSKSHSADWNKVIQNFEYIPTPMKLEYLELHERYGDGNAEAVFYESIFGMVYYPFLIRKIQGTKFVDITTPYGYGGPLFKAINEESNLMLAQEFIKEFERYCLEIGVVSEFIRFTPHLYNHLPMMRSGFPVEKHCDNVVIDLKKDWKEINSGIRHSYISQIRRIEKLNNLKFSITAAHNSIEIFYDLYHKNMEYKKIKGYFNFKKLYIELLASSLGDNVLFAQVTHNEKIINSAIFILSKPYFIDYFLAASSIDYKQTMGSHYLVYKIMEWAKNNGFYKMQLGGGHSSLLFFKSGFSKDVEAYFVSKIIRNPIEYSNLTKTNIQNLNSIFPAYR